MTPRYPDASIRADRALSCARCGTAVPDARQAPAFCSPECRTLARLEAS